MTQLKFKICVVLLVFSLLLTMGTVVILRNSRGQEQPLPSNAPVLDATEGNSGQGPVIPTEITTLATTEATMAATTEPTTQPTTEETTIPETTGQVSSDIGILAAQTAAAQVGKPYKYGTAGPDSFDTSGLVQYCFKQCGISVPRSNSALAEFGYTVDKENILPGDAVFFWSSTAGAPEYLGIYIGDGMVVTAMNPSKPVVEFNMNSSYYTEHFVFVRRFY